MHRSFSLPPMPEITVGVTLVCVTDQYECERLIQGGKIIAQLTNTPLQVIHIAKPLDPQNPEALEFLYRTSAQHGGEMLIEFSQEPSRALIAHMKKNNIVNVITGVPYVSNSLVYDLWERFERVNFFTVEVDGEIRSVHNICKTTA